MSTTIDFERALEQALADGDVRMNRSGHVRWCDILSISPETP
jgi:hypothetical protein